VLAETQREMTIFQKRVYLTAKAYHSEKEQEQAKSNTNTPSTPNSRHI
jgi:hypothetical protein